MRRHRPQPDSDSDPFYVGYLPMPPAYRQSMRRAVVLIAIWSAMMSLLLVLSLPSPGKGQWEAVRERSWSGLLLEEPYPMIVTQNGALLVVSMGKHDARDQLAGHFGQQINLRGYELHRDGRRMIELAPDSIHTPDPPVHIATPELRVLDDEPQTFTGEIVDGKCFLGAMKPGEGMGHRACAVLCLTGGLPPMFADEKRKRDALFPLLVIDGKSEMPPSLMGKVACRVSINARRGEIGGLPVLIADADDITLLSDRVMLINERVLP